MLISLIINFAIMFSCLGLMLLTIKILTAYHSRKKRRSPFPQKFLRGPGQSLIEKIDEINTDLQVHTSMLMMFPFFLYSIMLSSIYFRGRELTLNEGVIYLVGCFGFTGYFLYKIVQGFNLRRKIRLGYEGEVATGQELNQMMLQGYHVYHDFPADKFNIDHILVGAAGVFAVETKARSKPSSGKNDSGHKVVYDGKYINFPGWRENRPLEQAVIQAEWLERWLSSATGEKTRVLPVVALPGWYITRTSSNGIPVINPKQFRAITKHTAAVQSHHEAYCRNQAE